MFVIVNRSTCIYCSQFTSAEIFSWTRFGTLLYAHFLSCDGDAVGGGGLVGLYTNTKMDVSFLKDGCKLEPDCLHSVDAIWPLLAL